MQAGRRSLAIVASMILSAPAPVAEIRADEPAAEGPRINVVASPAILPPGKRCCVELNPQAKWFGTVQETFEGKIASADDQSVTLSVDSFRRNDVYADALQIPMVDRLFTSVGIGRVKPGEEFELRIPAEKIRKAELMRD